MNRTHQDEFTRFTAPRSRTHAIIDAEREFELDIDGHGLIGFIDAVYRTPEDELLVIDYKATERHRDLGTDKQLPISLLACRDLYDEPASRQDVPLLYSRIASAVISPTSKGSPSYHSWNQSATSCPSKATCSTRLRAIHIARSVSSVTDSPG